MLHWLNVHIWGPMWPNIFAPSAITLAAIVLAHYRQRLAHSARYQATIAQVKAALDEQKTEFQQRLDTAHAAIHRRLDDHADLIRAAADAQVNAGAGSNPAKSEGLPADQRVVPPAAAVPPVKSTTSTRKGTRTNGQS